MSLLPQRLSPLTVGSVQAILAALSFSLMALSVNHLSGRLQAEEIIWFRSAVLSALLGPYLLFCRVRVAQGAKRYLFLRACFGGVGGFCNYYSFQYFSASDANFLISSLVVVNSFLVSQFLFKNRHGWQSYAGTGLVVSSLGLFYAELLDLEVSQNLIYPVVGSLAVTGGVFTLKKATEQSSFALILFVASLFINILSTPVANFSILFGLEPVIYIWLLGITGLAFCHQFFLTQSSAKISPALSGLLLQSAVVWTYMVDIVSGKNDFQILQCLALILLLSGLYLGRLEDQVKSRLGPATGLGA